jgi:flagellin
MSIAVQNNIGMNSYSGVIRTQHSYNNSLQQISSGKRINSSADDAAGLFISQEMNGQIRGMVQGNRNALDGVSMLQTADGALDSIHNALGRMKELAVQASNGILSDSDRAILNEEFSQLKDSISEIGNNTEFNGKKLLDGSLDADLLVGANSDQVISLSGQDMRAGGLDLDSLSISNFDDAQRAIEGISKAAEKVSDQRSEFGAYNNRLESSIDNTNNAIGNLTSADSKIEDADIALAIMKMSQDNIMQQSGLAVLAQANQSKEMTLSLLK